MHEPVKAFTLEGIIGSDLFVTTRERIIVNLESDMRDEGYVPVLDMVPQFTREFVPDKDHFQFVVTVYGAYVGDSAWQISGVTDGRPIERSTPSVKSRES